MSEKRYTIDELIIDTATAGLELQNEDGSFPAGQNGPYRDNETPVRNTSHWAITMFKTYERSNGDDFYESGIAAIEYLSQDEHRPKKTFQHRIPRYDDQDQVNGLIGQAWTIEALAIALNYIQSPEIFELAADAFLSHPFNTNLGIWEIVDVDGEIRGYDTTFNHQLWFAMAGGLLQQTEWVNDVRIDRIRFQVETFLNNLNHLMRVSPSGYIIHPMLPSDFGEFIKNAVANKDLQFEMFYKCWRVLFGKIVKIKQQKTADVLINKSVPYHSFNLYALAVLSELFPEHSFWSSSKFDKVQNYSREDTYLKKLEGDKYSYGYNPPGLELPYAWFVYNGEIDEMAKTVFKRQLRHSYDFQESLMTKGTQDPKTHAARFYELTRLPNFELVIDVGK